LLKYIVISVLIHWRRLLKSLLAKFIILNILAPAATGSKPQPLLPPTLTLAYFLSLPQVPVSQYMAWQIFGFIAGGHQV
jgi:hypothetical protein